MNANRAIRWLVFAVLMLCLSAASFGEVFVGISVRFGPPALPVYAQPICPGLGYLWVPGYWAWDDLDGYYWVPGTWVFAPVGMLWTPGYWGWGGGFYVWHPGYWGPHVGFYGGINYGFGYTGVGFWGGEWRGGRFFYNRSVTNINVVNVANVYERKVVVNTSSRVSFNGGSGGISARPTPEEDRYARDSHTAPLSSQVEHERAASQNRQMFASQNHGRPGIAATGRPGEFSGRNVVAAKAAGERYRAPKMTPQQARVSPSEARGAEQRSENNREVARPNEGSREASRNARQQAGQDKAEQRREQQQARREQQQAKQEQKRQQESARAEQRRQQQEQRQQRAQKQQEQRRQQQAQKAERKRQQQEQKRQSQEQRRSGHEGHDSGR